MVVPNAESGHIARSRETWSPRKTGLVVVALVTVYVGIKYDLHNRATDDTSKTDNTAPVMSCNIVGETLYPLHGQISHVIYEDIDQGRGCDEKPILDAIAEKNPDLLLGTIWQITDGRKIPVPKLEGS